ncbi:SAM-dependent chlorinase/fluorinase, partial [Candidatus Bathyarchaeota archaeon]|nr:SAM-dependent chlorinase/fluorinase [Candidatus Bathyarchaeota archaeon]
IESEILSRGRFEFGAKLKIEIKGDVWAVPLRRTYSETAPGELLATIGGHGFLELAVNQGDAAGLFGIQVGTPIILHISGLPLKGQY